MVLMFDSVSSDIPHTLKHLQIKVLPSLHVTRKSQQTEATSADDDLWSQFDHAVAGYSALGEPFEALFSPRHDPGAANLDLGILRNSIYRRMPRSREKGILRFEVVRS